MIFALSGGCDAHASLKVHQPCVIETIMAQKIQLCPLDPGSPVAGPRLIRKTDIMNTLSIKGMHVFIEKSINLL